MPILDGGSGSSQSIVSSNNNSLLNSGASQLSKKQRKAQKKLLFSSNDQPVSGISSTINSSIDRTSMEVDQSEEVEEKDNSELSNTANRNHEDGKNIGRSGSSGKSLPDTHKNRNKITGVGEDSQDEPKSKRRKTSGSQDMATMVAAIFQKLISCGTIKVNNGTDLGNAATDMEGGSSPSSSSSSVGSSSNSTRERKDPVELFVGQKRDVQTLVKAFTKLKSVQKNVVLAWTKQFEERMETYSGWSRLTIEGNYTSINRHIPEEVRVHYPGAVVDPQELQRWIIAEKMVDSY
jgi:hypothetical protein